MTYPPYAFAALTSRVFNGPSSDRSVSKWLQQCQNHVGSYFRRHTRRQSAKTKIKRPSEQQHDCDLATLSVVDAKTDLFVRLWPLASHLWRWTPGTLWNTCQDPFSRKDFCGVVRSNWANQPFASCVASTFDGGTPGESNHPEKNYWRRSFSMAKPKAKHKIATGTGVAAFA